MQVLACLNMVCAEMKNCHSTGPSVVIYVV